MNLPSVVTSAPGNTPRATDPRLRGRWLVGLRVGWVAIALFEFAIFLASIPAYYAQLVTICTPGTPQGCVYGQATSENGQALQSLRLSLGDYAASTLVLEVAVSVVFLGVGALVFWRKSHEGMGLFVSLLLITFGSFGTDDDRLTSLTLAHPGWQVLTLATLLSVLAWPALGMFFYLFPDGRFVPRWAWIFVLLWIFGVVAWGFPPDSPFFKGNWPPLLALAETLIRFGSAVGILIYRYLRVSDPAQRQQTKWVVFGFSTTFLSVLILSIISGLFPLDSPYQLAGTAILPFVYLSISLSLGIAILRYRLWDIDAIINKALVYGLLTALLAGVYAGLIIGLEHLASLLTGQSSDQPVALVVSTLVIAALFLPVRRRIQNIIDRRFYRKKYDAEQILAAFSATLRNEVDLEQVRAQVLAVVKETMQPAHVSLWLRQPERRFADQAHRLELPAEGTSRPILD